MTDYVVDFLNKKREKERDPAQEELDKAITEGKKIIADKIEEASSFATVTFDSEGEPSISFGGDLDTYKMIGALEHAKQAVLSSSLSLEPDDDGTDE